MHDCWKVILAMIYHYNARLLKVILAMIYHYNAQMLESYPGYDISL